MAGQIKDSGVEDLLKQVAARVQNLRPVLAECGEILLESIQQNFLAGGRPDEWKDLSEVTKAKRAERDHWPGDILRESSRLLRSINYRVSGDQVSVGTNVKYAPTQHYGARRGAFGNITVQIKAHTRKLAGGKTAEVKAHTREMPVPWGDIPARPFMMYQTEDVEEIKTALRKYLIRQ